MGCLPFLFMKHFFSLMRGYPAALLFLLTLTGPAVWAQAPAWQSAMAVCNNVSHVTATAADATGNVYVLGDFRGTATFGSTTLTSAGLEDIFVAKWNSSSGAFAWALRAGGPNSDGMRAAIAVNGPNIYVSGGFSSTAIAFGSTVLTNTGQSNASLGNSFVAKLTDAGNSASFTWAQLVGGSAALEVVTSIAVNGTSLYITGSFASPVLTLGNTTLTAVTGDVNVFVAKLSDAGSSASFAWALQAGGTGFDQAAAIASSGNAVYVAGLFRSSTASFGSTVIANATPSNDADIFLAKLTDLGNTAAFQWAQQAGGTGDDYPTAIAASGGSIYLTGAFTSPAAVFGPTTLLNFRSGNVDVFVSKVADAGTTGSFVWTQQAGGIEGDLCSAITVRGANLYIAGSFGGPSAAFGGTVLTSTSFIPDLFVAKLLDAGPTGSFQWAQRAGIELSDEQALAVAISGNSVVVGGFLHASPVAFGTQSVLNPTTGYVGFLASLTDPTLTATTAAQGTLAFTLAPNPARSAATVQLPAVPGATTATLALRDALGRTLRTVTVPLPAAGLRQELDLSGIAPGLYVVQVRAGSTRGTQRLVVE